jgi:hypothetical protein
MGKRFLYAVGVLALVIGTIEVGTRWSVVPTARISRRERRARSRPDA